MSKIKAVDFAKYVEESRVLSKNLLQAKGIDTDDNRNLHYYINKFGVLPDKPKLDEYVFDSYFAKLREDYNNDPLRAVNGGEYLGCAYFIIAAKYDTSHIPSKLASSSSSSPLYTKTSDGQEFTKTSAFTITWDKSKDVDLLDDGTVVRWIKCYSKSLIDRIPCGFYKDTTTNSVSPLLYMIWDLDANVNGSNSMGKSVDNIYYSPVRAVIYGKNCIECSYTAFYTNKSLEYVEIEAENFNLTGTSNYFISECNILNVFKFNKINIKNKMGIVNNNYGLKEIDLTNVYFEDYSGSTLGYLVTSLYNVETLILPEILSGISNNFYSLKTLNLNTFIDNSTNTTISAPLLENLIVGSNWNASLYISNSSLLTKQSVLNIFNNLKDLTGETSKKLTLALNLQLQLTEEELAIATNKNWTISFV